MRVRVSELLRFWFTYEDTVGRGEYLRHGVALMAVKYGVDAALVGLATGTLWTPLDYLQAAPFLLASRLSGAAPYLAPALAGWTLPFLWVGVSMTQRRLIDAGWSAWWSLLYFVPLASYVLIAVLIVAPGTGSGKAATPDRLEDAGADRRGPLPAMGAGAALGLVMMWLSVVWMESYGLALFMGTPYLMGLVTGYVQLRRAPVSAWETHKAVAATVALVAAGAFVLGVEGAVCLLMIAPLGLVLALMGGVTGRFLARRGEDALRGAVLVGILLPATAALESGVDVATLREVRSSVVIDAPAAAVWDEVVAFSPIPEPTALLFRLGLAYPTSARIEGEGVGAVRYCVFSTGAFIEPITAWEPGRRLSFDVVRSPPPLRELSLWQVSPPHLEGYLTPRRGEFRLVPLADGRTRLEGRTWYEQRLRPEGYWVLFSDPVIGMIHRRVLDHIRGTVEARPVD